MKRDNGTIALDADFHEVVRESMARVQREAIAQLTKRVDAEAKRAMRAAWLAEIATLARARVREMLQDDALRHALATRIADAITTSTLTEALGRVLADQRDGPRGWWFERAMEDAIAQAVQDVTP